MFSTRSEGIGLASLLSRVRANRRNGLPRATSIARRIVSRLRSKKVLLDAPAASIHPWGGRSPYLFGCTSLRPQSFDAKKSWDKVRGLPSSKIERSQTSLRYDNQRLGAAHSKSATLRFDVYKAMLEYAAR